MAVLLVLPLVPMPSLLIGSMPRAAGWRSHQASASAAALTGDANQTLTVELVGCRDGVGVGLDGDNIVDLLKPGLPAEKWLKLGDRVIKWNGQPMSIIEDGQWRQRLLKEVVKPADAHVVVVERACKPWEANTWQQGDQTFETTDWSQSEWG